MEVREPIRVSHDYTQSLIAPPATVFPLLCPVRECEWVPGWEPGLVVSATGVAESDAVFTTPEDAGEATWYITEHHPEEFWVEMLKIVPGHVATRLRIELEEADGRDRVELDGRPREILTRARVRYTHTALSPEGEDEVRTWNEARWLGFMQGWESVLNAFLAHS